MSFGKESFNDNTNGFEPVVFSSNYKEVENDPFTYKQLVNAISLNIQSIAKNVSEIQEIILQLRGFQNTAELRSRLESKQQHTNHICKETAKYIRLVSSTSAPSAVAEQKYRKTQVERLMADFSSILNSFQLAQRDAADLSKEQYAQEARSLSNEDGNILINLQGPMEQQTQAVIATEELQEIQEREDAIRQLEADIVDVNMIFKDLGTLVHEQGDLIDCIEANVEQAETHVVEGNMQLLQATQSVSSARKKKLILGVVGVCFFMVLFLAIYFSFPNN